MNNISITWQQVVGASVLVGLLAIWILSVAFPPVSPGGTGAVKARAPATKPLRGTSP